MTDLWVETPGLPSRAENRKTVLDALNALNVSYEFYEHEPVYTMEAVEALPFISGGEYAKNLFLRNASGKTHYLVIVRSDAHPDLKKLAHTIGSSRLSFGSAERLARCLKVAQGSVSASCVLNDPEKQVQVIVDRALRHCPRFGMHPNDNSASLWLSFDDVERLFEYTGHSVVYVDFD